MRISDWSSDVCSSDLFTPDEVTRTADGATLDADGAPVEVGRVIKMSKSKKNVVDPDAILDQYGADAARWFMLSDSPPERDLPWSEAGIEGAWRFVQRLWRLFGRSEEHTSELQSLMRISYAVFCLKKKKTLSTRY